MVRARLQLSTYVPNLQSASSFRALRRDGPGSPPSLEVLSRFQTCQGNFNTKSTCSEGSGVKMHCFQCPLSCLACTMSLNANDHFCNITTSDRLPARPQDMSRGTATSHSRHQKSLHKPRRLLAKQPKNRFSTLVESAQSLLRWPPRMRRKVTLRGRRKRQAFWT